MATVATASCVLIVVQTACIVGLALTSSVGDTSVAWSYWLASTTTWYDIANGVSCLLYSFAPCFVVVEMVNAMKNPAEVRTRGQGEVWCGVAEVRTHEQGKGRVHFSHATQHHTTPRHVTPRHTAHTSPPSDHD